MKMIEKKINSHSTLVDDSRIRMIYDRDSDILDIRLSGVSPIMGLGEDEEFPFIAQWFGKEGGTVEEDVIQGCMIWSWVENGEKCASKTLHHIAQKTGWDEKELTRLAKESTAPYEKHAA